MPALIPQITLKLNDNQLGQTASTGLNSHVVIGPTLNGVPNTVYTYTTITALVDEQGGGMATEQAANILRSSNAPVYVVPTGTSSSGSTGTLTDTRVTGNVYSSGVAYCSGLASGSSQVILLLGTAAPDLISNGGYTYDLSLDNGLTYAGPVALPTSGLVTVNGVDIQLFGLFYDGDSVRVNFVSGETVDKYAGIARAVGVVSTGTFVISGTPIDEYNVKIVVKNAGVVEPGTALRFTYSLDGGKTESSQISCPSSGIYDIPNTGVAVTLAGFFNAGDVFEFSTSGPSYGFADAQVAFDAFMASPYNVKGVHFVGTAQGASNTIKATNAAAFATAVSLLVESRESEGFYSVAYTDGADVSDIDYQIQFANVQSKRLCVGAGMVDLISAIDGRFMKRSCQWPHVAFLSANALSTHSGEFARGALAGVTKIYRDERLTPNLDLLGFTTTRTELGIPGFYITRGLTFAGSTSDFRRLPNMRVMNEACTLARRAAVRFLNTKVRTNAGTGTITEDAANVIESYIERSVLNIMSIEPDIQGFKVTVDRTWNVLSTSLIKATLKVRPFGYAEYIDLDISFTL